MRIPLIGVPKHLWETFEGGVDASAGLVLWRLFIVVAFFGGVTYLFVATGGTAIVGVLLFITVSTFVSALFTDDITKIWTNLWNAEWGEAEV